MNYRKFFFSWRRFHRIRRRYSLVILIVAFAVAVQFESARAAISAFLNP